MPPKLRSAAASAAKRKQPEPSPSASSGSGASHFPETTEQANVNQISSSKLMAEMMEELLRLRGEKKITPTPRRETQMYDPASDFDEAGLEAYLEEENSVRPTRAAEMRAQGFRPNGKRWKPRLKQGQPSDSTMLPSVISHPENPGPGPEDCTLTKLPAGWSYSSAATEAERKNRMAELEEAVAIKKDTRGRWPRPHRHPGAPTTTAAEDEELMSKVLRKAQAKAGIAPSGVTSGQERLRKYLATFRAKVGRKCHGLPQATWPRITRDLRWYRQASLAPQFKSPAGNIVEGTAPRRFCYFLHPEDFVMGSFAIQISTATATRYMAYDSGEMLTKGYVVVGLTHEADQLNGYLRSSLDDYTNLPLATIRTSFNVIQTETLTGVAERKDSRVLFEWIVHPDGEAYWVLPLRTCETCSLPAAEYSQDEPSPAPIQKIGDSGRALNVDMASDRGDEGAVDVDFHGFHEDEQA